MLTKFYTPHVLLQEFIQCIMVIHAEVDKNISSSICRYPPAPQNSLFFYINDRISVQKEGEADFVLQPRSVIVGPQFSAVKLDINRNHKAVRVGFHPGGLFRLLGISMAEMVDVNYDATDVFGKDMVTVNDKLQEAGSFDEIKDVIEQFLLQKLKKLKAVLPFDMAMLELMRLKGSMSMENLTSLACLSSRQFERVSKERIGAPPKYFARLIRFSEAYRLYEKSPQLSWTNIAYECGYFDQAHFIRDFKLFAGVTPGVMEKDLQQTPVRLQAELRL